MSLYNPELRSNLDNLYHNEKSVLRDFLGETRFGINRDTNKLQLCDTLECINCRFYDARGLCQDRRATWLDAEYKPNPIYDVGDILYVKHYGRNKGEFTKIVVVAEDTGRSFIASSILSQKADGSYQSLEPVCYDYEDVIVRIGNLYESKEG